MKTIEEIISDIATDFITENRSLINNDAPLIYDCIEYTINRFMEQPLSDRLTAEERERILQQHGASIVANNMYGHEIGTVHETLERIFGKSMFAEEGGSHD